MFYLNYSSELLLYNILFLLLAIFITKPNITFINPQLNNKEEGSIFFFLLLTLNSIFAFWSADTYHSWDGFIVANQYLFYDIWHYEKIYNWLATVCGNEYFIWRTCIWGPACLFMYITAMKLKILNRNLLVSILLFGFFLSYTRGMLGHTMMLLGAVLFFNNENRRLEKYIGLLIICISFYFHKSMFVNIIFAILATFPLNRKRIKISLILFPFLTIIATRLINNVASGDIDMALGDVEVGNVSSRSQYYASSERASKNLFGHIYQLIEIIPQYLTIFYLYKKVIVQKLFSANSIYKYLFQLTYVSFYIASLFYFVETSSAIYDRFKYMGLFPLVFILGKVISMEYHNSKLLKWIIILQAIQITNNIVYKIYSW